MGWWFFPQTSKELFLVRTDHTDFPGCLYWGSLRALFSAGKVLFPGWGAKVNHFQVSCVPVTTGCTVAT